MGDAYRVQAIRVRESGGREASVLQNGLLKVMIDDLGGMIPELSQRRDKGFLNAHWIPEFRNNSGLPYDEKKSDVFWKVKLLSNITGNFPCSPNFGSPETADGIEHPAHGWAANEVWRFEKSGIDPESGAVWALSTLESPEPRLSVSYRKIDALVPGEPVHYTSLEIENSGKTDLEICLGWHNTVGSPFLQAGCRIAASAERFSTPGAGSEFDPTGRLAIGAEFHSLAKAPLRSGGTCDLTTVPGLIGYTDFISGPVPGDAALGWSAVVNPVLKMVYSCFFPGPAGVSGGELSLSFNDFWMQYGGRSFTPWAAYEGGTDRTFCLGTENVTAAFGDGLARSRERKELMGAPTTARIPAGGKRILRYGTLFASYEGDVLDAGIFKVDTGERALIFESGLGRGRIQADPGFEGLKALERVIG
jgi:hypothetical protein